MVCTCYSQSPDLSLSPKILNICLRPSQDSAFYFEISKSHREINYSNIFLKRQGRRICGAAVLDNSRSGQHTGASHQAAIRGSLCGPA